MPDDAMRSACFASLDVLVAQHGDDVPYRGGLEHGFAFRGQRIPFLSPYKGIFRASAQQGRAALSINTSASSPYDDVEVPDGFLYAYRAGDINQPDNRALRAAHTDAVPIVYFVATRPGWYKPLYPSFVLRDDVAARVVLVTPGRMVGPMDERDPETVEDPIERRYVVREARVRLHQARFRGRVITAYASRCAICTLRESRLLDAAHILSDLEAEGEPAVSNGLSLCSIHHRAFDQHLVGVSPDYRVHVSHRLLDDEDGPMLELLKHAHQRPIQLPHRRAWLPDQARLATRFARFQAAE